MPTKFFFDFFPVFVILWGLICAPAIFIARLISGSFCYRHSVRKLSIGISIAGIVLAALQATMLPRFLRILRDVSAPPTITQKIVISMPLWSWAILTLLIASLPLCNDRFWKLPWLNRLVIVVLVIEGSLCLAALHIPMIIN